MAKPVIEFNHFGFKYRSQAQPTLYDINLTIYEGEKVVIVGPSGSGKSTLAHCLNGLIPFSYKGEVTGSLKILGQEAKDKGIYALSKMVGTVVQDPDAQFVGITVGEDIAFALENDGLPQSEMVARVEEASRAVEMEQHLLASVHQLSGGQKQRTALAGVMVDHVRILLFDEPLANLDPAAGKRAMALIDRIQKEMKATVVIIEHRLEDVLHAHVDRIVVMNDGRIVAEGAPDQVLASSALEENGIREPLYVKALKYAGCEVTPAMRPARLDAMEMNPVRERLYRWYEAIDSPAEKPKAPPVLELKDIRFGYAPGREVIHGVSFSIGKGEMVSLVGKNGAGKSTLTKLICGFEKPDSGEIVVDGRDMTAATIKERALKIGLVMQNPNHMISKQMLFDEVALGLVARGFSDQEIEERVEKTLKICGLWPFRHWPIAALSFGQKKRATIASVLALEPEILILDEPTAGQDFRHYTEIMEFLTELNRRGITILMITHDMHLMLEYTPRAIVMADGRVIADESAVRVLADPDVMRRANLRTTSLFELAVRAGIGDPVEFVRRFIAYDKEARGHDRKDVVVY
ncbi:ABC transporter ATP-binding protein [Caenibacillus caldisaponilyticus]|uniref:ABC transporter ATP-binding protein n=1 Tax=Caenibacillus caldisaponilyticus TaxID=1674942 RepID=UPI0009884701|nr:ABC transporter ATP-binding protein [Caenibacillus caldisaponilyticus]